MKLIESNQKDVFFTLCESPITIDKRESWGEDESNFQQGPNGAFLKMSDKNGIWVVSHIVQIDPDDNSVPVGWIHGSAPYLFSKKDIWIDESRVLQPGSTHELNTLDGVINYTVKENEPCLLCYNGGESGPDTKDVWAQRISVIEKNYLYKHS